MNKEQSLKTFVNLSAVLTGFPAGEINPPLDPQEIAQEYFNTLTSNIDSSLVDQLLTAFQKIETESGGDSKKETALVEKQIMLDPKLGPVARRIIRMWYLSIWYKNEPPGINDTGKIISMNAYTRGLSWMAFQAHPMGYSEMHFGYWANAPVSND